MLHITILNSVPQIGTGAPLVGNNYILDLIWGIISTYLFDLHSKDENGNLSSSGTTVLLKFDALYSLENYIRSVYYNAYPMTLYFQLQIIKVHCTATAKSVLKTSLKKERLSAKLQRNLNLRKRKYQEN